MVISPVGRRYLRRSDGLIVLLRIGLECGWFGFVARCTHGFDQVINTGASLVMLNLNTPGGEVDFSHFHAIYCAQRFFDLGHA